MTRREAVQRVLARCYVALAEVDWDLRQWQAQLAPSVIDLRDRDRAKVLR